MTTVVGGLVGTQAVVAFGANDIATTVAGVMDRAGLSSMAFSMPRDGTITSIAAYYSLAAEATLAGSTVTITAQIYSSPTPNDSFTPLATASVTLAPSLTGVVAAGAIFSGINTGIAVPVTAGTRLLMVFTASVTAGIDVATILTGFTSGGITIL